ncbi:membrane hypothetical protein [Nitrospira sp. ND1]|jgi:hypothetical protein|uniref:hypothetical protein n=1 Tax=Nitrospira sp. ND1 TaxID=1658518 RepID=UPI0009BACF50|nr:hypothetical protein [Nitrospira sp. ND1]SLM42017.1 membrane hypothetical protein [Nitrospira sp. ND1]
MKWTKILLCAALAWLPFSVGAATFEVGLVTLTLYMTSILLLIPMALYRKLIGKYPFGLRLIDYGIILLCSSYLTSTLFASNPLGAGYLAVHAIFVPVASYYVIKALVETEKEYRHTITALTIGFSLFSLVALAAFIESGMTMRVRVLSRDAIAVSTMSMVALVVLFISTTAPRLIRRLGILASMGGLVASMARSYLVLLVFAPGIWRIVRAGRGFLLIVIFLGASLGGTLFLSSNLELMKAKGWKPGQENGIERLTNIEYWKEGLHGRLLTFRESLRHFEAAPIFGTGLRPPDELGSTVHNFHLEWLEYGGVAGYLLCAGILLLHFMSSQTIAVTDPWCAGNLTMMFLLFANGLTNGMMHGLMPYLFFILLGLNEARLNISKQGSTVPPQGVIENRSTHEPRILGF